MRRMSLSCLVTLLLVSATGLSLRAADETKVISVLLLDGQNNHDWRSTSPWIKSVLEETKRFKVDVTSNLRPGDKPGNIKDTVPFPPDLSKYHVIVSNYNGAPWPKEFQQQFDTAIREGKIGLVIVHAANNAFQDWPEYNQMIGMGWRDQNYGERLKVDDDGKVVRVPRGKDLGSGHRYVGEFSVTVRDTEHPVTRGMPREWLHARDELYDNMRGPIRNIRLLATAYSKALSTHEPMIWTISYGKGRVFHTPLGHDLQAMRCNGFVVTLQRGTEWAATGEVTQTLPETFPTEKKGSVRPAR